ncbi:glycosyltransferase family 2 protein [Anaerostipes butyraticus]|uniref:Uncharacterized protein n=1 Tax=Anaerostipes butyraticus TaxID=645466 RepID=A0A916VE17_9FIRM|nr:hypothetical protein [Anaerostipes butyraticus]GFO85838.1 hypothetical protein ANBU17_21850 [Anaerostipes butyraticus]
MKKVKNGIVPLQGVAVSIDMCSSTKKFIEIEKNKQGGNLSRNQIATFQIVEKMYQAIMYAFEPYKNMAHIIQFTGDGALLFFSEELGLSTAESAVEFGINFLNIWKKFCVWSDEFKQIVFRVCLEKGEVQTNPISGLWNGLVLNYASKMEHKKRTKLDTNRITISEKVMESLLENHVYKYLFLKTEEYKISLDKKIGLYNIEVLDTMQVSALVERNQNKGKYLKKVPICMCIVATETDYERIEAVLLAIEVQTFLPKYVLIYTSDANVRKLKKKSFSFKCKFFLSKISVDRAHARNILMDYVLKMKEVEAICFCDGDTLIAPKCIQISYQLFQANKDVVFGMPRIDLDKALSKNEIKYITNIFLARDNYSQPSHLFYWSAEHSMKVAKEITTNFLYLGSYFLFVPMNICKVVGKWDENFSGWGEEDIDFTYRIFLRGNRLIVPRKEGFLALHLTHESGEDVKEIVDNAKYLLSKYPEMKEYRKLFYQLIGLD